MYEYSICTEADRSVFDKQCLALEKAIPGIRKQKLLKDVDGSLIQEYEVESRRVLVYNDEYIGSVHVKSEVDLKKYFS